MRGAPTARLRRLDVPGGGDRGRALVALGPDVRADAVTAIRTLVTGGVRVPLVPVVAPPPPKPRWTRSPWLWAAVGAAATALVVLPFAIAGGGGEDNLDLVPGGALPPR